MSQATTVQTSRGEAHAILGESDSFPRFELTDATTPLRDVTQPALEGEQDLLVARRNGESRALLVDQMAYHHIAQGTLGGEPVVVMYCVVCDVAIGLTPVVDGRLLHLSAGGLSNGVVLGRDDETGSYWDVTGEAIAGPLAGHKLDAWPIERTNVAAALKDEPALPLAISQIGPYGLWWSRVVTSVTRDESGHLPFWFRRTMPEAADARRGELEIGLGVVVDGEPRFYPAAELAHASDESLRDRFMAHELTLTKSHDGVTWSAQAPDGSRPFQVWGRWYGFSGTFKNCGVYTAPSSAPVAAPVLLAGTAATTVAH
jgi:hypothetical protein